MHFCSRLKYRSLIFNILFRDIHQDNGELVDVANKIHGAAPTTCDVLLKSSVNGTAPIEAVHDAKPPPVAAELPESEDEDYDEDYEDHTEGQTVPAIVTPPVEPTPPVAPTTSDAPPAASSPASEPASPATPSPDATSLASEPTGPPSLAGGECSIEGQQKCIESGVSSQWLTCDDKKWIVRDCAPSLVCKEFNGGNLFI
jgi:hypothetical protein